MLTSLVFTALVLFTLYITYGVLFYGIRNSLSQLAIDWNQPLFTVFMWTELLLIAPKMFVMTPDNLQWMVFFIMAGIIFLGGAGLANKSEITCHIAGAVVACGFSLIWLGFINPVLLLIPLFGTIAGGVGHWQWGSEIAIIISIYIALL